MKVKGIFLLSICLFLLIGFVVYDHYSESNKEKARLLDSRLIYVDIEQVAKIKIENKEGIVEIEQSSEGWKLIYPIQESTDDNDIKQFVLTVLSERIIEVAREGTTDWSLYGLDKPLGVMTITDNKGSATKLSVGSMPNFEGNMYLRLNEDEKVLVVQGTWAGHLDMKLKDFRDRRVFKGELAKVSGLKVKNKLGTVELISVDGNWKAVGQKVDLEPNFVRDLLAKLPSLRAKDILTSQSKAGEFVGEIEVVSGKSIWKISLKRAADRKIIGFVKDDKKIYQMDEGIVAHFEDLTLELLQKKKEEVRKLSPPLETENIDEN